MGHAEPQVATTLQPCRMPLSPNKKSKAEPRQFARTQGMTFHTRAGPNLRHAGDALIVAPPLVMEDRHLGEIVTKLRALLRGL